MKKILFVFFCGVSCSSFSQTFPVDTLFKNGTIKDQINIVFLSDGYKASEMSKYITDVNAMLAQMFSQLPYKNYKAYFNAFAVRVPSIESGAAHPQNTTDSDCAPVPKLTPVNNYFGSTFDFAGIHRLLASTKSGQVANALASNFPNYQLAFIMVNSPYYGGSGGGVAVSSTHTSSAEVSIHEIGHSFGFLADEYWAGPSYAVEKPNLTQQSDPNSVKWKNWVGTNGVGVYAHAESPTWFRPHQACKMRALGNPFCSVCAEVILERIHSLSNPIIEYLPKSTSVDLPSSSSLQLSLKTLQPNPNTLKIVWKKDNAVIAKQTESITVPAGTVVNQAKFSAAVIDTTALTRSATHITAHVYAVNWTISINDAVTTGLQLNSSQERYDIEIFPNPVGATLNFNYTLPNEAQTVVSVIDMSGRTLKTLVNQRQLAGKHTYEFTAADLLPSGGQYVIKFSFNEVSFSEKIVRY